MTASERKALLLEQDRHRLELLGSRAAERIGALARIHANAALRIGMDPVASAIDVIKGNARMGLPGMAPLLRDGMVAAHLRGRYRTGLTVAPAFRASSRYKLAGTAYDDAIDFLKRRMNIDDAQRGRLSAMYGPAAAEVTSDLADELRTKLDAAMLEATTKGMGVGQARKVLATAFEKMGITPAKSSTLDGIFRTQTQIAYGAGRWNSLQDPAVQEILWGYEYVTVGDDRVRPTHAEMDGTKAPKDDPIWTIWWPPAGYNCRCSTLEIFQDESHAEPTTIPDVQPDEGFAFNPGDVYRDLLPTVSIN